MHILHMQGQIINAFLSSEVKELMMPPEYTNQSAVEAIQTLEYCLHL